MGASCPPISEMALRRTDGRTPRPWSKMTGTCAAAGMPSGGASHGAALKNKTKKNIRFF